MANVQKAVFSDSTAALLPNAANFSLALFIEMTGAGHTVVLVALELMEAVGSTLVGDDVLECEGK
jgi:hypothetical protein